MPTAVLLKAAPPPGKDGPQERGNGTMLDSVRTSYVGDYARALAIVLQDAEASDRSGKLVPVDEVVRWAATAARRVHDAGCKLMFVGNAVGAMKIRIVGHRHYITRAEVVKYLTSLLK